MTLKPVLEDGLYHIRFVPASVHPPFKGGLFATATELGEPILAEAGHAQGLQTVGTISISPDVNLKAHS